MTELSKRSTVYFDPALHQALRIKSATTHVSISELIDDALRMLMREDQEDLQAVTERTHEAEMSYSDLLNNLKKHGKI